MNDGSNLDLEEIKNAKTLKSLNYAFCNTILKAKNYPNPIILEKIIHYNTHAMIRLMDVLELTGENKKLEKQARRLINGPHKRFIVFGYFCYYPCGGSNDIVADFDSLEDAKKFIQDDDEGYEDIEIYDRENGIFVYKMD